eukprot:TRINITY_DN51946_c0_g1_i1.p5 TRINITY_DN51946_c0_g1~~TRINITY_DN51946_c0_g1_i1.p5  ORF type:complete len:104 (+),score=1.97 TRINITY_DN51946_c0_g1_i1:675-986(+)
MTSCSTRGEGQPRSTLIPEVVSPSFPLHRASFFADTYSHVPSTSMPLPQQPRSTQVQHHQHHHLQAIVFDCALQLSPHIQPGNTHTHRPQRHERRSAQNDFQP